ncbi:MAG TPA: aspartate/glutamate racemase family protein [Symbiobacteriaceae bacterium]|nr:aspartate/glutamate racemase family protein [Symbiobacteriaceae bacterium]
MTKTLALLHTTPVTVTSMKELAARELPGVRIVNLLDDSLLADVMAAGGMTEAVEARMAAYLEQARVAGADAMICCCSAVGETVDRINAGAPIPFLRIDEPMAEEAARLGSRIGVIATVGDALEPIAGLIRRKAGEMGKEVTVETVLVAGAFTALVAGRAEEHDRLVLADLRGLLDRSDVVVLAQGSMARLVGALEEPPRVPILTSPLLAIKAVGQKL